MSNKIYVGINVLGHDSSLSFFDKEKDEIFAIENERISRFKHDGISISNGLEELKKFLKIENQKIHWELSFCYKNEDLFKKTSFTWKFNILLNEIRKIFKLKEIKHQSILLKNSYYKILLKSFLKFPISLNFIFLSIYYFFFKKDKILDFEKSLIEFLKIDLKRKLDKDTFDINFFDHHTCHAASAFYLSEFQKCISISLDYDGDKNFSKVILFDKEKKKILIESNTIKDDEGNSISIGSIYSYCTEYLGFLKNSDEGKVEALAAYGNKNNILYKKLMESTEINSSNQIIIDKNIIKFLKSNLKLIEKEINKEDIAAAVQGYLEDFVTKYVNIITKKFNVYDVVLSGGTFANVKLNMSIYENSDINKIFIVPPMSDAGAGLGALFLKLSEKKIISFDTFKSKKFLMPYWGPKYTQKEILNILKKYSNEINIKVYEKDKWIKVFAENILQDKIGGLFQGRIEFGPRALGNRSIIGNASNKKTKDIINKLVKGRPTFQPFCPSILEEDRNEMFENSFSNKHMTCAFKMKKEYAKKFPSAVHIDDTARPQFVSELENKNLYLILKEIKNILGFGVCVNTSFNKHGRTMVLGPDDAIKDFLDSKMDFIFFENICITRNI